MILIHRCSVCRHNDLEGRGSNEAVTGDNSGRCASGCPCKRHNYGPPQVVPSFTDRAQKIERLAEPGSKLAPGLRTCICAACKAKYKKLTTAAA